MGDIVNYKGIIYSFDVKEGIRRFTGALWNRLPNSVDSHFDRVDMDRPRKLWGYANKLYFNYYDKIDGKAKCLIWDMTMDYQQYPWFQDSDVPFCDIRSDETRELLGIHPDYPCIMQHYSEDVWHRLDSPIVFERHTKYLTAPGNATDMVVKRIHIKVLADDERFWYFGVSTDKALLRQTRGKDITYRVPCWATEIEDEPVEMPFADQDIYEDNATARLSLSPMRLHCESVQLKARTKTFRSQASMVSVLVEMQPRQYN